jgi:hypothetical protein
VLWNLVAEYTQESTKYEPIIHFNEYQTRLCDIACTLNGTILVVDGNRQQIGAVENGNEIVWLNTGITSWSGDYSIALDDERRLLYNTCPAEHRYIQALQLPPQYFHLN